MIDAPIPFISAKGYTHAGSWTRTLQQAMPGERVVRLEEMDEASRAHCTVAIVANPDPADLRSLPSLRWIHSVWAGVEQLLRDLGDAHLKIVRLTDPQLAQTMAEAVLAWTLYLHRDMPAYAQQQARQLWRPLDYVRPERRTIGLLGLGALGQSAARRLLAANFKVCGWSREPKNIAGVESFTGEFGLNTLLAKTDILVCLLPLTAQTRGLLDAETLACLPGGASLINFSRGPIVNDAHLRAALDSGHLHHAVLDVFDVEPLPAAQWQWRHPHVTVLPHCSAPTDKETASVIVAANIQRYRETGTVPPHVDVARGY